MSGGTGTLIIEWNNGDTTNTINNLSFGSYAVTITDSIGCSTSDTFLVSYINSIQTQTTDVICFGQCTGSANTVSTGVAPFTYQWNNGATTGSVINLCAGIYYVTATDSNGVVATDTVVITEPTQLLLTDTSTNASCSPCNDGTATVIASGGTPPFTYDWSNGVTTSTIDSLLFGDYTVSVTDSNGCVVIDSVTVGFDVGVIPIPVNSFLLSINNIDENNIAITVLISRSIQAELLIYNIQGQLVTSKNISLRAGENHFTQPTPYAQGMYLLQVRTKNEVRNVKFVMQ